MVTFLTPIIGMIDITGSYMERAPIKRIIFLRQTRKDIETNFWDRRRNERKMDNRNVLGESEWNFADVHQNRR